MYTYLVAFTNETFVPIEPGSKIGQMKMNICREIVNLPFQIRTEEDVLKTEEFMRNESMNVCEVIGFSLLEH